MSTVDIPDMPAAGDGAMTLYYPNEQSGRLMFFHDHSYGITRLNVYAGEAAGYLLTDAVEDGLIDNGTIPGAAMPAEYRYGIPLIIQDKSFVPQDVAAQDARWDTARWGLPGDLWFPHVYGSSQLGEIATVTFQQSGGVAPAGSAFVFSGVSVIDTGGNPIAGVTATVTSVTLQ